MNARTVNILAGTTLVLALGFVIGCIKRVIPIPPPPSASSTLNSGLLLYLPFNGSVADASGNNNPATIVGLSTDSAGHGNGGLTTDGNGNANSAWGSNGTGAYVRVTNNGSIKYDSAFSLSFNVMVNVNNLVRQAFTSMVNTANAYGPGQETGLAVPYYHNYFLGVNDISAGCDNTDQYAPSNLADTSTFIPQAGKWYNIVNIYSKGTVSVYIDGQFIGSKSNSLTHTAQICPQSTFNVGYWWDQDMESLNGKIDEIRLYNRALTSDEISQLAGTTQVTDTVPQTDTAVALTKGLLLYLPFNGSIADSSGNGNPTTATGNVLTYDAHGYANSAFGATGNGERVYVTNNGSIKFDTAWSLSYGFMVNTNTIQQYFISMVDPTTGLGPSITSGISLGNGVNNFAVGSEDVSIGCSNYGRNDNYSIVDTTSLIPAVGAWYNAIATYYRGTLKVYINGQLVKSRKGLGTESNWCPSSQVVIGGWWNNDPLNMNGKLDNIRLYNRVLNANEIAALASSYQITSNSIKATPQTAH